ncbi:aldo/keto reductase [Nakamurella endophytica]|uniref:NADP-dependent aryl-alcohol dehydrogenase n=1 Tax=Nakamurella endophytica TaxID=1748367 RepID=A0A917WFQ6_9ACTN|nr:aldo/keto reductase [Nakamurella endophytica]GGL98706.1 NADP-dependent aryl-alcohol dehydrogenase [Nakamurella endophytica]
MIRLGTSDLEVSPLCLGGTVLGWTADEQRSTAVLDAYTEAGGNFLDTADMYSSWVPGHSGGESEETIGRWMQLRGNRDGLVVATKVGKMPGLQGTSSSVTARAVEDSLRRLRTDRIDLYYVHFDDTAVPVEETLSGLDTLVRQGKVRYVGASNFTADRLAESLAASDRNGWVRYVAVQQEYNLLHRTEFESGMASVLAEHGLSNVPHTALAKGFLTGKYRPGLTVDSHRAADNESRLDARGLAVLAALDRIADAHRTTVAAVALAWLAAQPSTASPIASARRVEQLADLLPVAELRLTGTELESLSAAGSVPAR